MLSILSCGGGGSGTSSPAVTPAPATGNAPAPSSQPGISASEFASLEVAISYYQGPLSWSWLSSTENATISITPVTRRETAIAITINHTQDLTITASASLETMQNQNVVSSLPVLRSPFRNNPNGDNDSYTSNLFFRIPGQNYIPGYRLRLDVSGGGQTRTIRSTLRGVTLPPFRITFFPLQRDGTNAPELLDLDEYMTEIISKLPVAQDYTASFGRRISFSGSNFLQDGVQVILDEWNANADADEYYMGLFDFEGSSASSSGAIIGRNVSISQSGFADVASHELGHNFGLQHAPCGNPEGLDPNYPYTDGGLGTTRAWDLVRRRFIGPEDNFFDLMGYCSPDFISDYHYRKALIFRQSMSNSASLSVSTHPPLTSVVQQTQRHASASSSGPGPALTFSP